MEISANTAAGIFESIRREAQSGRLVAGQALPPVRELAGQLNVNRNTVAAAYRKLVAAGIAETRGRNGTVMREPACAGEQEGQSPDAVLADLAGGNPDPCWLPDPLAVLSRSGYQPTLYGEPVFDPVLEALARRWFGSDCRENDGLVLAHGAVDAIERLLVAYLVAGDKVAVEDPCFLGSLNTLRSAGLTPAPVAMDAQGMRPEALETVLAEGAQALLCTPRAHNPTGCGFDERRATELRGVLARYPHVLLIEDDHFALLARTPYFSIAAVTTTRRALVRSVSKGLGPDLRLAFIACDAGTARRLAMRLAPGTCWVSHLLQAAVRELLGAQSVMAHLRAAGDAYAARRGALLWALHGEGIEAQQPCDGFNVWVPLPPGSDATGIVHALAQLGWSVRSGEPFAIASTRSALRITASTLEPADAVRFAAQLRGCLQRA